MKFDCDIEAFKYDRALREADEGWLIDAAFADILAGNFESETVQAALRLGHHEDYQRLRQARDDAVRAFRHAGAGHRCRNL